MKFIRRTLRLIIQGFMLIPVFILTPAFWATDKRERSFIWHWKDTLAFYHKIWD